MNEDYDEYDEYGDPVPPADDDKKGKKDKGEKKKKKSYRPDKSIKVELEKKKGVKVVAGPVYKPKGPPGSTRGPGYYVKYFSLTGWYFLGRSKAAAMATAKLGKRCLAK